MRKKESNHEPSEDEKKKVSNWVDKFIDYQYKRYQHLGLSESDVQKYLNLPPGIDIKSYVTQVIFESDLEYLSMLTLLSIFSEHNEIIERYFSEFGQLAPMSENDRPNSLIQFDERDVVTPSAEFEHIIPTSLISQYRAALVGNMQVFGVDFPDEELTALADFTVQVLKKSNKCTIQDKETADPAKFIRENLDWQYLIKSQSPGIFYSPEIGGMFSVSVPEKGISDHLTGHSSSVTQSKTSPGFDDSNSIVSECFFVVNPNKNAQLLNEVLKNKVLLRAMLKIHFLGKAQLMLVDKVGELFQIAAEMKNDRLLDIEEDAANHFVHELFRRIKLNSSVHFVTTPRDISASNGNKGNEAIAYQFSIDAIETDTYMVSVTKRAITDVFTTENVENQTTVDYELKVHNELSETGEMLPAFTYKRLSSNSYSSVQMLSLAHKSEPLYHLFNSMMPFSKQQTQMIYEMSDRERASLFSYLAESHDVGAFLSVLNNLSSTAESRGKRFLVTSKVAVQFVGEPNKNEVYVAKFNGTHIYSN